MQRIPLNFRHYAEGIDPNVKQRAGDADKIDELARLTGQQPFHSQSFAINILFQSISFNYYFSHSCASPSLMRPITNDVKRGKRTHLPHI